MNNDTTNQERYELDWVDVALRVVVGVSILAIGGAAVLLRGHPLGLDLAAAAAFGWGARKVLPGIVTVSGGRGA